MAQLLTSNFVEDRKPSVTFATRKVMFRNFSNSTQKDNWRSKINHKKNDKGEQTGRRVHRLGYYKLDGVTEGKMMVLNVENAGNNSTKPYYMEGLINSFQIKTRIDTVFPVTIFALDEIKKVLRRKVLLERRN